MYLGVYCFIRRFEYERIQYRPIDLVFKTILNVASFHLFKFLKNEIHTKYMIFYPNL